MTNLESLNKGIEEFRNQRFVESRPYFLRVINDEEATRFERGRAFLYVGIMLWNESKNDSDLNLVKRCLKTAYDNYQDIDSIRTLANFYYNTGDSESAFPLYEKGAKENDAQCLIGLCMYYCFDKCDGEKTLEYVEKLYSLNEYKCCCLAATVFMGETDNVKKNLDEAERWAVLGINHGIDECRDILEEIREMKKNSGIVGKLKTIGSIAAKDFTLSEAEDALCDEMSDLIDGSGKK